MRTWLRAAFLSAVLFICVQTISAQRKLVVEGTKGRAYIHYPTHSGETYNTVSMLFKTDAPSIIQLNGFNANAPLPVNRQIKIPFNPEILRQDEKAPLLPTAVVHRVATGENLYRISLAHNNIDMEILKKWNGLVRDAIVSEGDEIIVGFLPLDGLGSGYIRSYTDYGQSGKKNPPANLPATTVKEQTNKTVTADNNTAKQPIKEIQKNQTAQEDIVKNSTKPANDVNRIDADTKELPKAIIPNNNNNKERTAEQKPITDNTSRNFLSNKPVNNLPKDSAALKRPAIDVTKNIADKSLPVRSPDRNPQTAVDSFKNVNPIAKAPVDSFDLNATNGKFGFAEPASLAPNEEKNDSMQLPGTILRNAPMNIGQNEKPFAFQNVSLQNEIEYPEYLIDTTNIGPEGFFAAAFGKMVGGRSLGIRTGYAMTFPSKTGWTDKKYYILLNDLPVGSVVKVNNGPKFVYAKVLWDLDGIKVNEGLDFRISNAGAAALGIIDARFPLTVTLYK